MKKLLNSLKKVLSPLKNIFLLVTIIFIVWMLFFDANSWLIHKELNNEIDALNTKKEFYESEIKSDEKEIKILQTPDGIEKYAREKYNMKKENEDIYIIETDSLKTKK
ncbi:MAG: septum formation initiator family protein [Flavobacteriaceae bacterium]|jgi:cell division protein DivIC|nr:septum formation initiator family protein [Flavobacteriaceae bacterium]